MFRDYFNKMRGISKSPPSVNFPEIFWSWVGAFLGIATVALISYNVLDTTGLTMIIGSFGASAVLIYGAIKSPLAQPRNLLGGHVFSAVIGITSYQLFHSHIWFASAMAVATAIAFMHATKTLHPPGGGNRPDSGHRRRQHTQPGIPVCDHSDGSRRIHHVSSRPSGEQYPENPKVPRILAIMYSG
jgi:hypothetical protein